MFLVKTVKKNILLLGITEKLSQKPKRSMGKMSKYIRIQMSLIPGFQGCLFNMFFPLKLQLGIFLMKLFGYNESRIENPSFWTMWISMFWGKFTIQGYVLAMAICLPCVFKVSGLYTYGLNLPIRIVILVLFLSEPNKPHPTCVLIFRFCLHSIVGFPFSLAFSFIIFALPHASGILLTYFLFSLIWYFLIYLLSVLQ